MHVHIDGRIVEPTENRVDVCGDEEVQIDKLYGPLAFMPIKVTARISDCVWVIERFFGEDETWREVATIEGQFESDFKE